ncbi:MAG: sugar phosphate isomerase/epimerase [Bacteroidaceae bacterium]|nr:sugar phosphate isomerase/epimerase [Bacteroidaceae bacterium]
MATRRDFLKSASMLTLGTLAACNANGGATAAANQPAAPGSKYIGLQTYTLGGELYNDTANVIKKLAEGGYTGFELAGYNPQARGFRSFGQDAATISAADFKKMCDDAGIKIISSHLTPNNLERGAKYDASTKDTILEYWKTVIEDHKTFGVEAIVQPSLPTIQNKEDALNVCEVFNAVGELLGQNGIKFGYHNHSNEFNKVIPGGEAATPYYQRGFRRPGDDTPEPETIEKIFIENTDPSKVFFELDCYWTVMGQQDPLVWLKQYPNRIQYLHVKDFVVIGASGAMNWENIFTQHYANGNKYWFVEIEGTNSGHQVEYALESAKYLLGHDFV